MKVLFISEYPLEQKTSGCMHFKDIFDESANVVEANHLRLDNRIRHTSIFNDIKDNLFYPISYRVDGTIEIKKNTTMSFSLKIDSYYDAKNIYKNEIERFVSLSHTRYCAFSVAKSLITNFINGSYDAVILFLHEPYSIFLCEGLIFSGFNVYVIVMDLPEMRGHFYQNGLLTRDLINNSYKYCINQTQGALLPSDDAVKITKIFSAQNNCQTAYPSYRSFYDYNLKLQRTIDDFNQSLLSPKFILAGQIYAPKTLASFLKALQLIIDNKIIHSASFTYYGAICNTGDIADVLKDINIPDIIFNVYDPLEHYELQNEMRENYHFGYVPFPYDKTLAKTVNFSFPSKFISYVEAGVVPIYHGPEDSSVTHLLERFEMKPLVISELDISEVAKKLTRIFEMLSTILGENHYDKMHKMFTRERLNDSISKILKLNNR